MENSNATLVTEETAFNDLFAYIQQRVTLTDSDKAFIRHRFTLRHLVRKSYFLREGDIGFEQAFIISGTLSAFADSNSMALLITDGNRLVSDDGKLGRQLTDATIALQNSCDVALALVASSLIIGGSLTFKMWKMSRDV